MSTSRSCLNRRLEATVNLQIVLTLTMLDSSVSYTRWDHSLVPLNPRSGRVRSTQCCPSRGCTGRQRSDRLPRAPARCAPP